MSSTTRTTISVPRDLKARMEAEGQGVNWSAVACRAFEQELAAIITKRGAKDMQDVIRRLRASKAKSEKQSEATGAEAGREWAKNTAEVAELRRLELWRSDCGNDWDGVFEGESSAYSDEQRVFFVIAPEYDGDRQASADYWESLELLDAMQEPGFVKAFVEGALEVWGEVEPQL